MSTTDTNSMTHSTHSSKLKLDAEVAIKKLLSEIPFVEEVRINTKNKEYGFDLHGLVSIGSKKYKLIIDVSSSGQPLTTRNTIAIWENWKRLKALKDCFFVIISPYMSETSRNLCKESDVGFLDLTGNCHLCFGHIYIERFGFKHETEKRELVSIFQEKASRTIRRLLTEPKRNWFVHELASEARVSNGLASQVKKKILQSEIGEELDGTFFLTKPELLLKQWGEAYRFNKNKQLQLYSEKPLSEVERQLANYCHENAIEYAFTLNSAARLIGAQYVSVINRSHCYVSGSADAIAKALDLKTVNSGGNFVLLTAFDDDLLFNKRLVNETTVVSDIQLYLDFAAQTGRTQETAEIILDSRIKKAWRE